MKLNKIAILRIEDYTLYDIITKTLDNNGYMYMTSSALFDNDEDNYYMLEVFEGKDFVEQTNFEKAATRHAMDLVNKYIDNIPDKPEDEVSHEEFKNIIEEAYNDDDSDNHLIVYPYNEYAAAFQCPHCRKIFNSRSIEHLKSELVLCTDSYGNTKAYCNTCRKPIIFNIKSE